MITFRSLEPTATKSLFETRFDRIISDDYVPLTPESLLLFCQSRLRTIDDHIKKKMEGQNESIALQKLVGKAQEALKNARASDGAVNFDDIERVRTVTAAVDEAIAAADASGNLDMARSLRAVRDRVNYDGDGMVTSEEVKDMNGIFDSALTDCRSGAEVSMIELQSLISQRATVLQLTTGMMNSVNEASKAIAGNIR